MRDLIVRSAQEAVEAASQLLTEEALSFIEAAATACADAMLRGGKLLVAGNGGSLADAMHFAEELTGMFRAPRRALPAIALADPTHLACVANDLGYEHVFSRAVEALGKPGDVFVALTTSGQSENLFRAVVRAHEMGLTTVAFLGKDGGKIKGLATLEWIVSGFRYSDRIQEAHMAAIHILIEALEKRVAASEEHVALSVR